MSTDIDPNGGRLIDLVLRVKHCCADKVVGMREQARLSETEYACLGAMDGDDRVSVSELSRRMGLSESRGSRVIDQMVRRGLLERDTDDDDRRVCHVALSRTGRDLRGVLAECMARCETELRGGLTEREQTTVARGLSLILRELEKAEP